MKSTILGTLLGAMLMTSAIAAPEGWVSMSTGENGVIGYHTQPDKNRSLLVLVRQLKPTIAQTPSQWASTEVQLLRSKSAEILQEPVEVSFGQNKFVKIASYSNMGGVDIRMEQYFAPGSAGDDLVEITLMGPEEFFPSEKTHFESFLSDFKTA